MSVEPVKFYSEETKLFYKLVPTKTWPTVEISGIHMHRIKDIDPKKDSELKVAALGTIKGTGLDVCTGLGYTAILAARKPLVEKIVTIEKDPNIIYLAKMNPFSKELFTNPKIELIEADANVYIKKLKIESFDFAIHDPPRISLAPELYSLEFYRELFRVVKKGAKVFHYTGKPGIKQGKNYLKGILNRLRLAGFKKIRWVEAAQGFLLLKQ